MTFFRSGNIQRELNLNPNQINQLNQMNQQIQTRFQNDFANLPTTEPQRTQALQSLNQRVNTDLQKSVGTILDPQQRGRLRQVLLQQQGLNAFADPTIARQLNLTSQQSRQLRKLGADVQQQLNVLFGNAQSDPNGTAQKFQAINQETRNRIDSILNADQRKMWNDLVGSPFDFTPLNNSGIQ